jgi:hypothetical protein
MGTGNGYDAYINSVPGDDSYYVGILTINNGNTGTDQLRLEAIIPSHIPSDRVVVSLNGTYFESNIYPTSPNVVVITSKVSSIPVGQYNFGIKFNLPFDFYSMSTLSSLNPHNNNEILTVFDSGQNVSTSQPVTFYLFKNQSFQSQATRIMRWFNNYRFRYEIRLQRNPYVDGTFNVKLYVKSIGSSDFYTEFIDAPFVPIWNETVTKTILYKDPTRGTDYVPVDVRLQPGNVNGFIFEYYLYLPPSGGYKQQISSDIQYSGNLEVYGGSLNLGTIFRYNKNGITDLNNSGNLTAKAYNVPTILYVKEDGKFEVFSRTS